MVEFSSSSALLHSKEGDRLKRDAETLAMDLTEFLTVLSQFLPHSYLTDKIVRTSTSLESVWDIIKEHYGVKITKESLLDFEKMFIETGETHRQFYERLLQHVKQHMARPGDTLDGVSAGATGD